MSTQTEISRIQTARNTIRDKLVSFNLVEGTAKLDALAEVIKGIDNKGSVKQTLNTAVTSCPIEAGYHDGTGEIKIELEEKGSITPITPTKETQVITPSSGKVLSKVTVAAIPDAYQDVSDVETPASAVLSGYIIVNKAGDTVTGSMPDNGAVRETITPRTSGYGFSIPEGYHNGSGFVTVRVDNNTKDIYPTRELQNIYPSEAGGFFKHILVHPISSNLQDVSQVETPASALLDGYILVNKAGETVEGAMPNNGDTSTTMDGLTTTSATIPAGYTSGGTVSLTNDIETALAAI